MKLENVKGTFDYSQKEQEIREYIKDTLKNEFKKYGYSPLETPTISYFDVLALKYNEEDEILKEIYKVTDQGNRKLGLRYDLTVPFARFIAMQKNLRLPFKRYEIGDAFRDGPVKVGRNRQFVQCDVDVVGLDGQVVEAELVSMFINGFKKLDIQIEIKYNSRKLMQGLIEILDTEAKTSDVIKVIDKMNKINNEEFKNELASLGISDDKQNLLLKYFQMSFESLLKEFNNNNNNTNIINGLNELKELNTILEFQGYMKYMRFTPTLARGQEYYTGNIFEAYAINSKINSSIGAGGRYDNMITNWIDDGKNYPAVGLSYGLNVIYEILKNKEKLKDKSSIDIYIIPMDTQKETLALANSIRNLDYSVEVEMKTIKIKKGLEYANKERIPYVIILGANEIENQKFKLKNMIDGLETEILMKEITKIKDLIK